MALRYPDYESIIELYTKGIRSMHKLREIHGDKDGGPIRGAKGAFVEKIVEAIVHLAWHEVYGEPNRLNIGKRMEKIYIDADYVKSLKDESTEKYIEENINGYFYPIELDRAVEIDNCLVLGIECKAYTDNTMFRRALKDFELVLELHPELLFSIFQLENALGGDYGEPRKLNPLGSKRTHTLMSYSPSVSLEIITLLDGNHRHDRLIHDPAHFKNLPVKNVEICVSKFRTMLKPYV